MLTTLEEREVITAGVVESNAFTIKANGKAFKVLIDGLYSDKILAVIRELWTNAYDSHVMAGKGDVPFDCQLPSMFDPVFRVRDYGVSLTHDEVMNLYTTVFESTKEDTNDQVGKIGLGSKSPFAYVDTFTVTAWKDGEKRTYSAYIGADHVPQIALMSREDSDEPQGLEVSFPCKASDIHAFEDRAGRVARGFDVLPNVSGNRFIPEEETVVMNGDGWRLVSSFRDAEAKQGCVIYPIDAYAIPNITDTQRALLNSPLSIDFAVGELEINASREGLGYDETTCRNILARVDRIAAEIAANYEQEIKAAKTYWDALLVYQRMMDSALDSAIKKVIGSSISFRGKPMRSSITIDVHRISAQGNFAMMRASARQITRRKRLNFEITSYGNVTPGRTRIYVEPLRFNPKTKRWSPVPGAGVRIRYDWGQNAENATDMVWFKTDVSSIEWKRVFVRLGRPEVIDVSQLPMPPALSRYSGIRRKTRLRVLKNGTFIEDDVEDGQRMFYVKMERNEVQGPPGTMRSPVYLQKLADAFKAFDINVPIIGVPKSCQGAIKRNPKWEPLWDVARAFIDDHFDLTASAEAMAWKNVAESYHDIVGFVRSLIWKSSPPEHPGPAHELYVFVKAATEQYEKTAVHLKLLEAARVIDNPVLPQISNNLDFLIEAFKKRYHLASVLIQRAYSINDEDRLSILEYVNYIDGKHANEQDVTEGTAEAA